MLYTDDYGVFRLVSSNKGVTFFYANAQYDDDRISKLWKGVCKREKRVHGL